MCVRERERERDRDWSGTWTLGNKKTANRTVSSDNVCNYAKVPTTSLYYIHQ